MVVQFRNTGTSDPLALLNSAARDNTCIGSNRHTSRHRHARPLRRSQPVTRDRNKTVFSTSAITEAFFIYCKLESNSLRTSVLRAHRHMCIAVLMNAEVTNPNLHTLQEPVYGIPRHGRRDGCLSRRTEKAWAQDR